MIYICKACGRAMKMKKSPNFCYADRLDAISKGLEEISDEQALKMGLSQKFIESDDVFEFPGDVRFDPMTGAGAHGEGDTLSEYQERMIKRCLGAGTI